MPKEPLWIVGIDEVGRGPLAGPVTVCGIGMKYTAYKKSRFLGLTDSKKLSVHQREAWYKKARELETPSNFRIAITSRTAAQIDKKGISICIKECIANILKDLDVNPRNTLVLLDGGLKAPLYFTHQQTIIKGDLKHKIISLASVVAKVSRDAYMVKISQTYPGYDWKQNKGYGTKKHYEALKKLGFTRLHRKSFLKKLLDI
jgi:ribonuclease HII